MKMQTHPMTVNNEIKKFLDNESNSPGMRHMWHEFKTLYDSNRSVKNVFDSSLKGLEEIHKEDVKLCDVIDFASSFSCIKLVTELFDTQLDLFVECTKEETIIQGGNSYNYKLNPKCFVFTREVKIVNSVDPSDTYTTFGALVGKSEGNAFMSFYETFSQKRFTSKFTSQFMSLLYRNIMIQAICGMVFANSNQSPSVLEDLLGFENSRVVLPMMDYLMKLEHNCEDKEFWTKAYQEYTKNSKEEVIDTEITILSSWMLGKEQVSSNSGRFTTNTLLFHIYGKESGEQIANTSLLDNPHVIVGALLVIIIGCMIYMVNKENTHEKNN